jgi:nitrite reductase/ring-hydroxylating ferredoxin subunit
VRLHPGPDNHDLVIVGGEDHKTGQDDVGPAARYARLEAWARRRFSALGPVVDRWSGQILESIDGLAFIGRVERDRPIFVVTGDSGNGMTHGVLAGILLAALLAGEQHPWAEVYDPTRIRLHALGRFARENLNVAARYASWVAPQTARGPEEVPPGTGAVIRRGVTPIAVYRDGSGVAHERSAVCPHLGCIVAWNAAEQSWDCPCHGSRFDPLGAVVNGPATRPLAPIEREAPSAPADGAPRPPASPLGIDPEGRP